MNMLPRQGRSVTNTTSLRFIFGAAVVGVGWCIVHMFGMSQSPREGVRYLYHL